MSPFFVIDTRHMLHVVQAIDRTGAIDKFNDAAGVVRVDFCIPAEPCRNNKCCRTGKHYLQPDVPEWMEYTPASADAALCPKDTVQIHAKDEFFSHLNYYR